MVVTSDLIAEKYEDVINLRKKKVVCLKILSLFLSLSLSFDVCFYSYIL